MNMIGRKFLFNLLLSFLLIVCLTAGAQSPESYRKFLTPSVASGKLSPLQHVADFEKNGILSIGLNDAVRLALANNSTIRIEETQIEAQKFVLLGAHQPFDPLLQTIASVSRNSTPGSSALQGVGQTSAALNSLTQSVQVNYSEMFKTGTSIVGGIGSSRNSTNDAFNYLNPYYNSLLSFQFTQPLLRGAGVFVNTAPLVIARRSLQQSRASFAAQVNDAIFQVVVQYWAVVQARENLEVDKQSLGLAEASYQRDKRALELGALPPLDIYRSQAEVASRKLQTIQGEYTLKQVEEGLRLTVGADQDPAIHALELNLTEKAEPQGELVSIDMDGALKSALAGRPEVAANGYALENDATSIRLAKNLLLPSLSLTGFYQSTGLGGNQYDLNTGALLSRGGFGSSFSQLTEFGYPGYGASLTLSLPIRNRGAQAIVGNALVSRSRDLYADRQTKEQVTRQVTDAVQQLEEAKKTLEAGQISYDLSRKTLAAEQRKYELGAETNFFVLDAQSRLAQASLDLLQTQINYQVARAAVDHATGSLLTPYRVEILELTQ